MSDQNQSEKKQNEPLPDFKNEYWLKDADNQILETKIRSCEKHTFRQMKKAYEVKCDCGVGYILTPELTLREDGHIYSQDAFVI